MSYKPDRVVFAKYDDKCFGFESKRGHLHLKTVADRFGLMEETVLLNNVVPVCSADGYTESSVEGGEVADDAVRVIGRSARMPCPDRLVSVYACIICPLLDSGFMSDVL